MKNLFALTLTLLALVVPALAQTDIDGTRTTDELRVSTDGQVYSDGRNSVLGSIQETHRYTDKFAMRYLINGGEYFAEPVAGGGLSLLVQPSHSTYFEASGLVNTHTDVYQTWAVSLEAGTTVYRGEGFLKAVEWDYNQTMRGFGLYPYDTKAFIYTPRAIFYLPKNWDVMLHTGLVDIDSAGKHNPTPIGGIRLRIPVARHAEFTASAGWDSEGLTNVQQILSLSTRNYGAGIKLWFTPTLSVEALGTTSLYTVNNLSGTTYGIAVIKRF